MPEKCILLTFFQVIDLKTVKSMVTWNGFAAGLSGYWTDIAAEHGNSIIINDKAAVGVLDNVGK
jgi:hypothetical protein